MYFQSSSINRILSHIYVPKNSEHSLLQFLTPQRSIHLSAQFFSGKLLSHTQTWSGKKQLCAPLTHVMEKGTSHHGCKGWSCFWLQLRHPSICEQNETTRKKGEHPTFFRHSSTYAWFWFSTVFLSPERVVNTHTFSFRETFSTRNWDVLYTCLTTFRTIETCVHGTSHKNDRNTHSILRHIVTADSA